MKKTLAELIDPRHRRSSSIGELSKTLSFLLSTSEEYYDAGQWGASGPRELLINYGGCVNCSRPNWHSSRISNERETTTWQQNRDAIHHCILSSLCDQSPASLKWRSAHEIHLGMILKFPMAYQNQLEEQSAWAHLITLHKYKLPVKTLNNCHRGTNVLAAPQLIISRHSIRVSVAVTLSSELRQSPRCYSRWDYSFLTGTGPKPWNCHRETFAEFILRSVAFYKREDAKPKN